ncbi:MAG: hypothetical protein MR639_15680 [Clostridium sp.]|uniref:CorA family divalent cation transporter n=1 Tax=Clostridium sp. TaxID=1506 RepID=UPI002A8ADF12|nr:hypothetical protein [Clostridium sp.]MDY5097329.1 CorA family divalent cation transporter [Clostridium sp.]
MAISIYLDKTVKDDLSIEEFMEDSTALVYISDKLEDIFSSKPAYQNVDKDIDIINKDTIIMNIPYITGNHKQKIQGILEKDKLLLYIKDNDFTSFLIEKLSLEKNLGSKYALLSVFEYLCMIYDKRLLKMDEMVDDLFEEALTKNQIQMETILKDKKTSSIIKRFVNYYKSMVTYLEETFKDESLYNKLFFSFNYTLQMVDDVESSIYSCIEIFNSIYSNRMNKTMELLTIITIIALPATIITGAFGMNFDAMPLIDSANGFYILSSIIFFIIIIELIIFKWKKFM